MYNVSHHEKSIRISQCSCVVYLVCWMNVFFIYLPNLFHNLIIIYWNKTVMLREWLKIYCNWKCSCKVGGLWLILRIKLNISDNGPVLNSLNNWNNSENKSKSAENSRSGALVGNAVPLHLIISFNILTLSIGMLAFMYNIWFCFRLFYSFSDFQNVIYACTWHIINCYKLHYNYWCYINTQ